VRRSGSSPHSWSASSAPEAVTLIRGGTRPSPAGAVAYRGEVTDQPELDRDIARIDEQLRRLRFDGFDEQAAWELGSDLRQRALDRDAAVTIEVRLNGDTVFLHAMPGTTPANADWARRKRNVVELLHQPSYAVGLHAKRDGRSILEMMGLSERDHASHGGSFPIQVTGVGCVGAVTVSGLPQRTDHSMVVEALAARLSIPLPDVALD
jgi:uncharacterized protein (UPF0303 family)